MRKSLIILLLLFVIGVVSCFMIGNNIYSKRELIAYQQTTNYGDISSAQGLKLTSVDYNVNTADYGYNWQNELSFDGAEGFQSHTVFRNEKYNKYNKQLNERFYVELLINATNDEKLGEALIEFHQQKEYEKRVAVKDYIDYYPVKCEIAALVDSDSKQKWYVVLNSERQFADYFRIPVLDNEYYLIDEGGIGHSTRAGDDCFDTFFRSVADDEAIYLWFSNRTPTGALVDTSLIPGGYGIYRLPYGYTGHEKDQSSQPYYTGYDVFDEQLSTLYSLEEQAIIMDVRVFPQASQIVLMISLDDQSLVRIIDSHTGELIREHLLSESSMNYMVSCDDNYAYIDNEEKVVVIKPGQNPDQMIVTFDIPMAYQSGDICYRMNNYAYKDNTLAVVSSYTNENVFDLNIYGESGLIYSGTFNSNLGPSGRYPGIRHIIDEVHWSE